MGRSRGSLTTNIHALVDAQSQLIRLALTVGQTDDAPTAVNLTGGLTQGSILIADRAYDTNAIRPNVATPDCWANAPPRFIRKDTLAFSRWLYRERRLVERFFNKLIHFRGIVTRYDRRPDNFLAAITLAAISFWINAKSVRSITAMCGTLIIFPAWRVSRIDDPMISRVAK